MTAQRDRYRTATAAAVLLVAAIAATVRFVHIDGTAGSRWWLRSAGP